MDLDKLRQEIDEIDTQMCDLFVNLFELHLYKQYQML